MRFVEADLQVCLITVAQRLTLVTGNHEEDTKDGTKGTKMGLTPARTIGRMKARSLT
jgi:hypothetical protein